MAVAQPSASGAPRFYYTGKASEVGGYPWFRGMDVVSLEKEGYSGPLKLFEGISLLRRGKDVFKLEGGKEIFVSAGDFTTEEAYWPGAAAGDIAFTGKPVVFVISSSGMINSKYTLVGVAGDNAPYKNLFIPFNAKNLKTSPWLEGGELFLNVTNGECFAPGFLADKKILEIYVKNGPYYDTERWCFDGKQGKQGRTGKPGGQYYLCEKLEQAYHPESWNFEFVFVRRVRFDKQGHLLGVSCHKIEDDSFAAFYLTAASDVPLYKKPGFSSLKAGNIKANTTVILLDYAVIEKKDDFYTWYKVQNKNNPAQSGWCYAKVSRQAASSN